MKKKLLIVVCVVMCSFFVLVGCQTSSEGGWRDTNTEGGTTVLPNGTVITY